MLFIGAVGQVHSSSMCFIALLTCSDEKNDILYHTSTVESALFLAASLEVT